MKIVLPFAYSDPGGAQKSALRLALELRRRGHFPSFWLFQNGPFVSWLQRNKLEYVITGINGGKLSSLLKSASLIKNSKADVVYLHATRLLSPLFRMNRIPVIERINMSRIPEAEGMVGNALIDRVMTNLNTKLVAVSQAIADQLVKRGISPGKIKVIRNGVDTSKFFPSDEGPGLKNQFGFSENSPLVVNVGRMEKQKAQLDFIRSAKKMLDRRSDVRFLLVGSGSMKERVRFEVEHLGLTEKVKILDSHPDLASVYNSADVMLHTAKWEPLANVIIEAMATGLPVVATDVDGTSEAICHEQNGLLVRPGNHEIMADSVFRLINDQSLQNSISQNAVNTIKEKFKMDRFVTEHEELFLSLCR